MGIDPSGRAWRFSGASSVDGRFPDKTRIVQLWRGVRHGRAMVNFSKEK
jgi:hypothetical protein